MKTMAFAYGIATLLLSASHSLSAENETAELEIGEFRAKIYHDNSGIFGRQDELNPLDNHWMLGGKDEMTDKLDNSAFRMGQVVIESIPDREFPSRVGLKVVVNRGQIPKICVVGHDFPGRTTVFRVGDNPAISTNEDGCVTLSKSLEDQLRNGTTANVRGFRWPSDLPNGGIVNLDGFGELVDWLRSRE